MRFRKRRFGGKGKREPLHWFRQEKFDATNSPVFGTAFASIIFDPTTVQAGIQDLVVTLRAIRIECFPSFTFSASTAIPLICGIGVYIDETAGAASGLTRDPLLATAADQRTDWLYLARKEETAPAGALRLVPGINTLAPRPPGGADWNAPFIKAMRKMDQDQQLILSVNLKRQDTADTAPTLSRTALTTDVSVLWQMTRR